MSNFLGTDSWFLEESWWALYNLIVHLENLDIVPKTMRHPLGESSATYEVVTSLDWSSFSASQTSSNPLFNCLLPRNRGRERRTEVNCSNETMSNDASLERRTTNSKNVSRNTSRGLGELFGNKLEGHRRLIHLSVCYSSDHMKIKLSAEARHRSYSLK